MFSNVATKATVAKIRAKHGKMLTSKDYKELINARSVADIAEHLKKTPMYKDVLSDIETETIHRGYLEELLRRNIYNLYINLLNFQKLGSRDFYNYLIKHLEIEQILDCVMHFNSPETDYIKSVPSYLIKLLSFDLIELAKAKNFDDVLTVLKNTRFYDLLKDVKIGADNSVDYFDLEILLMTDYYNNIFSLIKKDFKGNDREVLTKLFKRHVEVTNMVNAYRLKHFFNASEEMIKSHTLPFYGQFNKAKMLSIYEAKTADEMVDEFGKVMYAKNLPDFNKDNLESSMDVAWYRMSRRALCNSQTAPVALYSFISLCMIEVKNLTTIIEAKRYDIMPSDIEKMLIM